MTCEDIWHDYQNEYCETERHGEICYIWARRFGMRHHRWLLYCMGHHIYLN